MSGYDHFQDTVYHVYDKEDVFPRVLRYFCHKQHTMTALQSSGTDADLLSHAVSFDCEQIGFGVSQVR